VMKSADLRNRSDAPGRWRLHFAPIGAVVVEGLMRAGGVVVREIPTQQTSEVPFVEHDDVIEAFPSNRADDALGEGILPGRSRRDEDLGHPQAVHPPYEYVAVDGIPIAEQVVPVTNSIRASETGALTILVPMRGPSRCARAAVRHRLR
jgi:hypothetical protein